MRKSAIFACLVAFLVLAWPVVAWEVSTNDLLDAKAKSVFPRLERIADEGAAGMKSPRRGRTPDRGPPAHWWLGQHDPLAVLFLMDQDQGEQDPKDDAKKNDKPEANAKRHHRLQVEPDRDAAARGEPTVFASTTIAVIFFVAGMIGWISLGVSAFILERRRPHEREEEGAKAPPASTDKGPPKPEPPQPRTDGMIAKT